MGTVSCWHRNPVKRWLGQRRLRKEQEAREKQQIEAVHRIIDHYSTPEGWEEMRRNYAEHQAEKQRQEEQTTPQDGKGGK